MQRRWKMAPATLVGALVLAMAGPAAAGPDGPVAPSEPPPWDRGDTEAGEFADDMWFLELAAAPSARGGSPAEHAAERAQLRSEARSQSVPVDQREDFTTLYNGLTVNADVAEIAALERLDSVVAVHPVAVIDAPEPDDIDPELATALSMTGADTAQSELGLTGEGLSVAVVDTGMDYNHPDLGGEGDEDRRLEADADRALDHPRVTHGYDYVGDEFDASDPDRQEMDPNPDPMDVHGHGTHVGGIVGAEAAADDGATGVAPEVTFGAYKVFGTGSTTSEVIVEALEDAYEDGMDVVNMSLGAAFAWGQEYPTSQASNELAAQGVTVVNSAGNSGGDGAWTLSAPANAHDIISVASADNTEQQTRVFEVEQLEDPVPYMEMSGAELPPEEGDSDEVVHLGRACTESEGDELPDDPEGRTALIERGDCPFAEKYLAAADAGATGVVIYNNVSGLFAGTVGDEGVDGVWGAGIADTTGQAVVDLLDDGETVTLDFTDERASTPNPTGGLVSSFSSYGQDVELEFGPSIMAPGGLINSTYPLARGGYATLSGTSMSAPHVAGAVALLLEAEPDLDPFEVRDRLQNTAEPALWSLNPGLELLDHTFRQGAGMTQIDRAVEAGQAVAPAQVAMGDQDEVTTTLTVSNDTEEAVTYEVGHEVALEIAGSSFTPGFFVFGAQATTPDTVEVPANGTADVPVTIASPDSGAANHQFGGYLTLTSDDEGATALRVPYSGFDGDYTGEMGLLGYWDTPDEFVEVEPELAVVTIDDDGASEITPVEEGHTYTIRDGELPVVAPFYGHFPRHMELWAVNQDNGERLLALEDEYLSRSPGIGDRRPMVWDGLVSAGRSGNMRPVPSGEYVLELRLLRAMGDPDDPDDWDVWESAGIELDTRRGGPPSDRGRG